MPRKSPLTPTPVDEPARSSRRKRATATAPNKSAIKGYKLQGVVIDDPHATICDQPATQVKAQADLQSSILLALRTGFRPLNHFEVRAIRKLFTALKVETIHLKMAESFPARKKSPEYRAIAATVRAVGSIKEREKSLVDPRADVEGLVSWVTVKYSRLPGGFTICVLICGAWSTADDSYQKMLIGVSRRAHLDKPDVTRGEIEALKRACIAGVTLIPIPVVEPTAALGKKTRQ